MYLDAQTIITFASLLTAIGVIAHYLNKGHQWYMKQEKQDVDITAIQNEIVEQKKEQRLHTYALLACLKGLKDIMEKIKNDVLDLLVPMGEIEPEGNLQLPTPSLLQYYLDRKARVVWIDKDIDSDLFNEIRQIIQYNREDEKNKIPVEERTPIRLFIQSYGGTLDSCFSLLDVMKISTTPIYTYNFGTAMSAAALIYINGHKRFAMPKSTVLLHSRSGGSSGGYEQVVAQTENYKRLMDMLKENILEHSTIDKAYLTKQMKKEWYIYIDQQTQYGLTDFVIENISQLVG